MQKILVLSILLLIMGCGKPAPTFSNMDINLWKEDKFGCKGNRLQMRNPFLEQKEKLKGLSESEIIRTLGRPDANELYKRNQKFYHYFISGAKECASDGLKTEEVVIRFNAMGLAKEIVIE